MSKEQISQAMAGWSLEGITKDGAYLLTSRFNEDEESEITAEYDFSLVMLSGNMLIEVNNAAYHLEVTKEASTVEAAIKLGVSKVTMGSIGHKVKKGSKVRVLAVEPGSWAAILYKANPSTI